MIRDTALVVLYDDRKRILLQLRDEKAPMYPNCWGFFGGGLDLDETPVDGAKREFLEELCYELRNPQLAFTTRDPDNPDVCKYFFVEEYREGEKFVLGEGAGYEWFSFGEAYDRIPESHKFCIREIETFLSRDVGKK